jgi:methionyl-tRNA formyltransferase
VDTARALGIDVLQPADPHTDDVLAAVAAAEPDVLCLCAYGALVKAPLLDRYEILNVHPSLLPRWRGAAPVERAIMAGDAETGVSIMRLLADLDAGPVCLSEAVPIGEGDTYGTLAPRLQTAGARLLARALDESPPWVDQPDEGVTYAERITAEDRTLDPEAPPEVNERIVRALHPHIGARVQLDDGSWLGVLRARADEGPLAWHGLDLLEVQPPGGKPMDAGDYLRGRG